MLAGLLLFGFAANLAILEDIRRNLTGARRVMSASSTGPQAGGGNETYAVGLARAFGGAIIFAFPLLMTMEMWWLGLYMSRFRLVLFLVLSLPLLVGLSYFSGFQKTFRWRDDLME